MDFGDRLKELRLNKRLTQQQVGDIVHVSKVSISGYERGERSPDRDTLTALADYFEVSTDYLLGRSETKISNMVKIDGVISKDNEIPILGRIVASNPEGAVEDYEGNIAIQDSVIDKFGKDNLFALRVNGDSMNKIVIPGSIAIIHKTDCWKDGDICAVLINGDEATLKKVYRKQSSIRFEPDSWNPMQKPWEYTEDMDIFVSILGVYVYSIAGI